MGAWHNTYAELLRTRFSALVAYANLLVDDNVAARELAQNAALAVFSRRRTPKGTRAAELAARDWMAAHAQDPTQAAIVLQAIDGKDAAGIKAVLRKSTPNPLPGVSEEQTLAMRMRFVEESRVYAVPSGGVNTIMAPARSQHLSAMGRAALGAVGIVAAIAAAGFAAVKYLPLDDVAGPATTASASPSASLTPVTWNPRPGWDAAFVGFNLPACGEEFKPMQKAVGGITPEVRASLEDTAGFGAYINLVPNFVSEGEDELPLLADPYMFVITLDHKVVYTPRQEFNGLELFHTNAAVTAGGYGVGRWDFCDGRAASEQLSRELDKKVGYKEWDAMSDEERALVDAAWEEFQEDWQDFEPGTYRVFYVTPMVFGDQLALAELFAADGVEQVQALTWDLSWTPLADDPRVAPYCTGSRDAGDKVCNAPPEVIKEVLTRDVDPNTFVDTAPGVGISVPMVYEYAGEED